MKTRTNVYDFNFHLVWVIKYRKAVFTSPQLKADMVTILKNIAHDHEMTIQEIEVMPDHVHLLLSFPPKHSASFVVNPLRCGAASSWFKLHPDTKQQLWSGYLWATSYFMSTLGNLSKSTVENYIQKATYNIQCGMS